MGLILLPDKDGIYNQPTGDTVLIKGQYRKDLLFSTIGSIKKDLITGAPYSGAPISQQTRYGTAIAYGQYPALVRSFTIPANSDFTVVWSGRSVYRYNITNNYLLVSGSALQVSLKTFTGPSVNRLVLYANSTYIINTASVPSLTNSTESIFACRFRNATDADFWWDGVQQYYTTHSTTGASAQFTKIGSSTAEQFGDLASLNVWSRYLDDSELRPLLKDPYDMYEEEGRYRNTIYFKGTTSVTGTLARTNANDTLAASGTTTITGTLLKTNANDTLAASGTTTITGTLLKTNANDTLAASGTTTITGTLSKTNANDTLAASGTTTITGTLSKTNANDTLAASGTTTITGTLSKTNANDTLAASGSVGSDITGSVNYTNANDTLAASGTTTIIGTLTRTNADDTLAASGTITVTGTLARTNANDTLTASGATTITGTLARTNADDTLAASGTSGSNISGTLATTNANDTLAASGTTTITGTLTRTNANDTLVASGTTDIIGSLFRNNNNDTSTATGSTTIIGAIARTNANDTVIASGFVGVQPVDFIDWILYARPGKQVIINQKTR